MEVLVEVCDVCSKKHGVMLKRDGIVFGDRRCFLDFCNSIWLRWEKEEFQSRGIIGKASRSMKDSARAEVVERSILNEASDLHLKDQPKLVKYK